MARIAGIDHCSSVSSVVKVLEFKHNSDAAEEVVLPLPIHRKKLLSGNWGAGPEIAELSPETQERNGSPEIQAAAYLHSRRVARIVAGEYNRLIIFHGYMGQACSNAYPWRNWR